MSLNRRGAAVIVAVLFIAFAGVCHAFKPDEPGHVGITEQALASLGFCRHARDAVEDANVLTDIFEQLVSEAHFDDETLRAGSRRLLEKRQLIIELIRESIESEDGENEDDGFFGDLLDDDDFALGFFEDVIDTGLDLGRGFLSISDTKQSQAWTALGQALHSLQDFYSHSNWVEMGSTDINTRLGEEELDNPSPDTQPCAGDPGVLDLAGDGGNTLTTSYFLFDPSEHCELLDFPGKCRHGWDLAGCAGGLNKDEATRPGNAEAKAFAITATAAFVDAILDDLRDISSEHRDRFLGGEDCSQVPTNETLIFRRRESLSAPDTCDTFTFEIDEVGSDYLVKVELKNWDSVTVRDPSNDVVDESRNPDDDDDYYSITEDDDSFELYMKEPTPGLYSIEVCGNDDTDYTVDVTTESSTFPFHFYFTRLAGTRNEGLFPHTSAQQPILNEQNNFSAEIYGTTLLTGTIDFSFVALDGVTVLQDFTPATAQVAFDGILFEDSITITTTEPFLVRAVGQIEGGSRFVRVFSTKEYEAQVVEVQYTGELTTFQLGRDQNQFSFDYALTNRDTVSRTFTVSLHVNEELEDSFSGAIFFALSRQLASDTIGLGPGEEALVTAELTLEDDDDLDFGDILQVTLIAESDVPNSKNGVDVIGQYVACRGDPVCSGQGICQGNSEVCNCFFGFSNDDCSDVSGSSFSATGSAFSPSPGNFGADDDDDDDNNNNDSSASTLVPFLALVGIAALLVI